MEISSDQSMQKKEKIDPITALQEAIGELTNSWLWSDSKPVLII
jgi:hypothetical protein